MDENARRALGEAGKKYLERFDKFDDQGIGRAWVEIAKNAPKVGITTGKGLTLTVHRKVGSVHKVSYEAFIGTLRKKRVAWMHTMMPVAGRVQITNANVYDVGGVDYRRRGIGTAIYDLIERDVRAAGGDGIEPHFGSMSDEAIEFWKKRRPDQADKIADLNRLGAQAGSWLFD